MNAALEIPQAMELVNKLINNCIVFYFVELMFIAAKCAATFSDLFCSPEFRYY